MKFTVYQQKVELEKLIPNELGTMKKFFITVISTYYDNIHPIIWTQIFKGIYENLLIELPFTKEDLFRCISKQILLNSGPFILKILQMIRPILSEELQQKYNLKKLTYPLLNNNETDLILNKILHNKEKYNILYSKSASVGHVIIVLNIDSNEKYVIKIIKPLSIAQSCWEYSVLYDIFDNESCESKFIKNMLNSNGREMNTKNEIENIKTAYKYYNCDYKSIYGIDIEAKLTTVKQIDNIIKDNWYSLVMSLAPGIPLSDLIEQDLLKKDTKYRASLHRSLDLLITQYFKTIALHGFYHGDLHSGNIFYSYKHKQMTLIDFGAVGNINLFENKEESKLLLEIIIMSIFYNFDEIFDKMTILLNTKCDKNTVIKMDSDEYISLKNRLYTYKMNNIKNHDNETKRKKQYEHDIFSDKRINDEKDMNDHEEKTKIDSIYSYLEIKEKSKDIIIENKEELPVFTEIIGDSENITFSRVLKEIIEFYAKNGVNIAIKLDEFYEFQKAYLLLLGVLYKVGYSSYRMQIAMNKAFSIWTTIKEGMLNISTEFSGLTNAAKIYLLESNKFSSLKKEIKINKKSSEEENFVKLLMTGGNDTLSKFFNTSNNKLSNQETLDFELDKLYKDKYIKYKKKYLKLKHN